MPTFAKASSSTQLFSAVSAIWIVLFMMSVSDDIALVLYNWVKMHKAI
jgi:hypothetical protein